MKKLLTVLFLFVSVLAFSQNNGINFQGVGRNSSGAVLASTKISLRFSVIQSSETGTVEYVESKEVTTNAQGIFSVVIGDGTQISKTGNFSDINWKINPKFLKVEMDPAGGSSFVAMGTTRLQAVPFAYYANGVNADNVDGVLSASKGGTGVASISALKTALAIDQINNTSDLAKPISTATQAALDMKVSTATFSTTLAAKANTSDLALKAPIDSPTFTGTVAGITKAMVGLGSVDNTSDLAKPISTLTKEALDTKVSTSVFSTTVATKANTSDLALKAPIDSPTFTGTVAGITKAMVGLGSVNNTSDLAKPISTATQEALDTKVSASTFSTTLATKVSTETFSSTVATKENANNKSTATDLGASETSDILFPTQKAVKTYVDGQINSGGVADNGILTRHIADGAITDAKVATGINKAKVGLSNVENMSLSTWQGSNNLTSVGTITSGTWSASSIDFSKLSIQKSDLTALGLVDEDNVIEYQAGVGLSVVDNNVINGRRNGSDILRKTINIINIDANMMLDETIITSKIADAAVTNVKIADGAITNSKITNDAITNTKIFDGAITDSKLSTGLSKSKFGLGNVENTALSTWTGTSNIASLGTINSGTWSGTTIAINKGGTGATNAVDARANLGLIIGTNVQAPLSAGVDYLAPNGSAANLTSFPTLNQNTSGNAATATLAGNISATSNSTLTSLVNLNTVGTIATGVWSGTTISISNGGTGSTSAADARANLGLIIGTHVQSPLTAGIHYLAPNGSAASLTNFPILNQNTTGNATTATLAGNITATSNSTIASLQNLSTIGTITTGVWSATTISVNKGGTGSSSLSLNSVLLGNGVNALQTIAPGTSGNVLQSNGSTWTSAPLTGATAGNLTGTTLASNVLYSSLTSVGVLTNTSVSGNLVVGLSAPTTNSAVLELHSTTKGLLPPRMSASQRDAIINPLSGLIIWCNNCGQTGELQIKDELGNWTNLTGGNPKSVYTPLIGDTYQGGVVYYLLRVGDVGYDPNLPHGLIMSTEDQGRVPFGIIGTPTYASSLLIGNGKDNTDKIVNVFGTSASNYAAGKAREYRGGGYSDWYLPSKDELVKLYDYCRNNGISNIMSDYWSSSEINPAGTAYFWVFTNGSGGSGNVSIVRGVRAIRSF